jgi:penicillin-binding protein 2
MQSLTSSRSQSWLLWFYKGLIVLGLLILVTRLIELQIIKGAYYHALAEDNRIRRVSVPAPRGKILARGGEVLVTNKELKLAINFSPESGYEKKPATDQTPQEEIIIEWQRSYELGPRFGHLSGYLGEVNQEEVGKVDPNCPEKGPRLLASLIGRSGLEEYYNCLLSGIDGEELVEVDSLGNKIRTIGRKKPLPGTDLHTTIDLGLQKVISSRLKDKRGAIIVSDTKGEILALYSSPSYDPNIFIDTSPQKAKTIQELFSDSTLPLFNRAIFKPVTAVAALEEGAIDKDYLYEDTGSIKVNEFEYTNWYFTQYGGVEGLINLERALARSTDTFFYKVGELLGAENLANWAIKFGLDQPTGIDLPGEVAGLVPTPQWKKAVKGERWFLGNTYHMAIGQGDLSITPIEANQIPSIIASGGKLCQPHLVTNRDQDYCRDLNINQETIDTVKKGMISVCAPGGTAFPFFDFSPSVACKTGTAETSDEEKTHAWFTVFAPAESPEIILTVLIEEGGEGSADAGPIAREIFDYWFHNR